MKLMKAHPIPLLCVCMLSPQALYRRYGFLRRSRSSGIAALILFFFLLPELTARPSPVYLLSMMSLKYLMQCTVHGAIQ